MIRRLLRFLGWIDRKPGDMWPFPFAASQPLPKPSGDVWKVDRHGTVIKPERRVVLKAKPHG